MSFGFGVGDFVAVIGLASRLRKDFSNAPKQYQAISSELKDCSLILQEIDVYLDGHDVSDSQAANIYQIVANSDKILKDLEKVLTKYGKLGTRGHGLRGHAQRIWQRVTWEPEEIRDFRNRLNANITLLNAFADGFNRQHVIQIGNHVTKLVARQVEQTNQEILDWLSPIDHVSQHADHVRQRLPETGQWLIDSSDYEKWMAHDDDSRLLLLFGVPGTGKTVLSSIIIDNLQEFCSTEINMSLCYYYCDYNHLENQQLETVLLCLLRQLLQATPILPGNIRKLYDKYRQGSVRPPLKIIKDAFRDAIGSFWKVYIIMDALDESQTANGFRRELLFELIELSRFTNINLLVTSRPLPDIINTLTEFNSIEIRASNTDIAKYVEANIPRLPAFVGRNANLQDEIKAAIIDASDGIFLLATFYTQSLVGSRSPRHLRKAMESFGHGTAGYHEAYTKTMVRIRGQAQEQTELAVESLTWIVHAERLLTCEELVHALGTDPDESEFYEDSIPDIEDVLSVCCGLLLLEEKTRLVRLVHRTAQEFFKKEGQIWLPEAQTKLSKVCNAYLSFVNPNSHQNGEAFKNLLTQFPFYNYATLHWLQHAESRETPITVQELLAQQEQVYTSSQALLDHLVPKYLELCQSTPGITGLHLIAYHGLVELLPSFLEKYDINSVDRLHNTALSYAIQENQEEVVRLLIDNGADVSLHDSHGRVPLSYVVERDDKHFNKFHKLIADPNKCGSDVMKLQIHNRDKNGLTPLMYAARSGRQSALEFLLENGADINYTDDNKDTALVYAISARKDETVFWLLSRGANPNLANNIGRTPLIQASGSGRESIVRSLIEHGADKNVRDRCGRNALHRSLLLDGHTIFDFLVMEVGIDTSARDVCGMGVSEYACLGWEIPAVLAERCLIHYPIDDMKNPNPNAPSAWHLACRSADFYVLRALLGMNIEVTSISTIEPPASWTPLDVAIYWANDKLVTADGNLIEDLPWSTTVWNGAGMVMSGIVMETETGIQAVRKNDIPSGIKSTKAICDYCLFVRYFLQAVSGTNLTRLLVVYTFNVFIVSRFSRIPINSGRFVFFVNGHQRSFIQDTHGRPFKYSKTDSRWRKNSNESAVCSDYQGRLEGSPLHSTSPAAGFSCYNSRISKPQRSMA